MGHKEHLDDFQINEILDGCELQLIQYMDNVFTDYRKGVAKMVPKVYLTQPDGDYRAMPASWLAFAGIKWVSVYPKNSELNLPTVGGTLILNDSGTGTKLISMDCGVLTAYRTAAVSALAAKYILPRDSVNTISFIGCGVQSKLHLKMYMSVFPYLDTVKLYDKNFEQAESYMTDRDIKCIPCKSVQEVCTGSSLITTLTPSTIPILNRSDLDLTSAVLINAIGADAEGKRELSDDILHDCQLIVDDYEQASHSGEMQYKNDLPYLTLDHIITDGIANPKKLTVFDSTGVAIEDIAIGRFIYEKYYG